MSSRTSEMADPIETDPDKYRVVFENERVRVLEYRTSRASTRARIGIRTA